MIKITIAIDTGNAAFEGNKLAETQRIIGEINWARIVDCKGSPATQRLYDVNGNHVGEVKGREAR